MIERHLVTFPAHYNFVWDFVNGLALAILDFEDSKYGYINKKGEFKIAPQFEEAASFSEGLAAVKISEKWGYIDTSGELVIPAKFDAATRFLEGLAYVVIAQKGGYIDKSGELVIPARFDAAGIFSEGLAAVKISEKWGYIDKSGELVIPAGFDDVKYFSEDRAAVKISERWGYIDKSGELIIPAKFDDVKYFSEDRAAVKISGRWGYIDKSGELVIPARFEHVQRFSEGLAAVSDNPSMHDNVQEHQKNKGEFDRRYPLRWESYHSRWGYIAKNGLFVTPLTYWIADNFLEGIAAVKDGDSMPHDTFGFINTEGKFVIEPSFENTFSRQGSCKWAVEDTDGMEYAAYEGVTVQEFIRIAKDIRRCGKANENLGNGWKVTKHFLIATNNGHRLKHITIFNSTDEQA